MENKFEYRSVLAPYMYGVINVKESCGFMVLSTKWFYKEFDDFVINYGLSKPSITKNLIEEWSKTRINDNSRTYYGKCSRLVQLARYMNEHGKSSYIMPLPECDNDRDFVPYIFSKEQMSSIFTATDCLIRESHRSDDPIMAIPCIIRLLYCTALRITEALGLKNKDVHLQEQYLLIRETKNGSERIIPINNSMCAVMQQYQSYRDKLPITGLRNINHSFFIKLDGSEVSAACVYKWFRKIYTKCGIPFKGDRFGPRVHDLRHTAAVHSMSKLINNDMDVYSALPLVSALLGHKKLTSTEHYVRLTCAEYPELMKKCSELNNFIYPKEDEN
jgi:integrase